MQVIIDLEKTKVETLKCFQFSESDLLKTYGSGTWNIRQILHHLADAETVLYDRIRRTIANPGQVVWGFDQDKWAKELDYNSVPLSLGRNLYESARNCIIYRAGLDYESKGHHILIHSGDGKKTLKDLFEKVVWHNQRHLDQIFVALES